MCGIQVGVTEYRLRGIEDLDLVPHSVKGFLVSDTLDPTLLAVTVWYALFKKVTCMWSDTEHVSDWP
jgi:hypothetical protein